MLRPLTGIFPTGVFAAYSDRTGGSSGGPYAGFNVGDRVGDRVGAVSANRAALAAALPAGMRVCWLRQVHGTEVVEVSGAAGVPEADAAVSRSPGLACAVVTADCLPVLLSSARGDCVAAVHAGWRGLAAGIIERTLDALGTDPESSRAWLGPAIGPDAFEVGPEVRARFLASATGAHAAVAACFRASPGDRYLCDLRALAELRLRARGVRFIAGDRRCTFADATRFYSHRRDGRTGRMAFLIAPAP